MEERVSKIESLIDSILNNLTKDNIECMNSEDIHQNIHSLEILVNIRDII